MARPNAVLVAGAGGVGLSILFFGDQVTTFWPTVFGFPLLAASMAALVAAGGETTSWIGGRALPGAGALAAISYSLYLIHKMAYKAVIRLMQEAAPAWQVLTPVLAVAAALAAGALLYVAVERPFLGIRDRFRRTARPDVAPVAQAAE